MKLSDTQLVVLSAACQRPDRLVLPLPTSLKGGAAQRVVGSLSRNGLVEEVGAGLGDPVWRTDQDGRTFTLLATEAAFQALGIDVEPVSARHPSGAVPTAAKPKRGRKPRGQARPADAKPRNKHEPSKAERTVTRQPRQDTKQAQLIAMLQQPNGASLDEIVAATGWQAHTVRGAIAGALKKKLGLTVTSARIEGRGRIYRI